MKTPHSHLLRLCVAEVLAAAGYQKSSKHALNILTDVTLLVISNLCKEQEKGIFLQESTQHITHGDHTLFTKPRGPYESLLHKLNILPKGIDYKGKGGGVLHGEIYDEESFETNFDDFVYEFVRDSNTNDPKPLRNLNLKEEVNVKDDKNKEFDAPSNVFCDEENTAELLLEPLMIEAKKSVWMDNLSYRKMISEKEIKILHMYENEYHCDVIDEMRCFVYREADKRGKR